MSYEKIKLDKVKHFTVMPKEAYKIIRNCAGCGCKMSYISTGEFRVNANGNKVDVWLIYQCEKCKHTYNLPIYERIRPGEIKREYESFLSNDKKLALMYGMNKALFIRNRVEIDAGEIEYEISPSEGACADHMVECIEIDNPYEVKIRTDKIVSQILNITRAQVKQLEQSGMIQMEKRYLGNKTRVMIKERCV